MDLDKIILKIRNSQLDETDVLKYGRILINTYIKEQNKRSEQLNSCEHNYINIYCDMGWSIIGKNCTKCGKTI